MNTIDLCSKLEKTTYLINAFYGSEPLNPDTSIGIGSGVTVNSRGDILTAAHVVTGRIPVRETDLNDPGVTYVAKTKVGTFTQYYPVKCGVALISEYLKEPLTIDLALLRSVNVQENVPFLEICRKPVKVGTQIVMAGFPDDMELPFSFDGALIIDSQSSEGRQIRNYVQMARHVLMMKSGMVGQENKITLEDNQRNLQLNSQFFYIDNELHSGGSGGPVIDHNGELIGVVTKRAVTWVSEPPENPADPQSKPINFRVPSGSALAISPLGFVNFIEKEGLINI